MSTAVFDNFSGPNGAPANFPNGIRITSGPSTINDIGVAGSPGFGVGVCPGPLPAGMTPLPGCTDPLSDGYGNYQYTDGSVMVWMPAFYYKWGTGANGVTLNAVDVKPFSAFDSPATAAGSGYALHRAFYDGAIQPGVFVDKYISSNNAGVASSLKNGIVLTSAQRGSLSTAKFSALNGAPADALYGAIAAAKTRGANFFPGSRFITAALALLSYAHGAASSNATYCAWYNPSANFPKGCNNNSLGDAQDTSILYVSDGNGTYNCGKTGSANLFARTTHNGQVCGVADLNGTVWEVSLGMASDGTDLYILNTSVRMKDLTAGNSAATDAWGAAGLAANYANLGATYESLTKANGWVLYGSAAQVFSESTSGNAWNAAGFGVAKLGGTGGTNAFGNDGCYQPSAWPNVLCPISGGNWADSSNAGVWALHLGVSRSVSYDDFGLRAALYL